MTDKQVNRMFPVFSSAAILCAVWFVFALGSIGLLFGIGRVDQIGEALATGLVCLAAGLVSILLIRLMGARSTEKVGQGFVLGMLLRMGVCLGALILLSKVQTLDLTIMGLWMGGWYLLVLAVEVIVVRGYLMGSSGDGQATQSMEAAH